ncbi:MAG: triosephosphate isomerase [Chaenotheca gracillima]|nr:MAG: triosephosphate isomerase [Chaenotheca gracillima]
MGRQFFVGGNFKMNGSVKTIKDIIHHLNDAKVDSNTDFGADRRMCDSIEVVIAPPSLYLLLAREHLGKGFEVAAQNVFDKPNGAFTGEISVDQLKDSEITWALVGHSERRVILQEGDDFIASKTKAALDGGLGVILCIGESLEQREQSKTIEVVTSQLQAVSARVQDWSKIVIAYEPIWAIGTGKVATTEQAQEVHAAIRQWLGSKVSKTASDNTRIIYGGSVSEKNCKDLAKQADIDGFLVGGASLKPASSKLAASQGGAGYPPAGGAPGGYGQPQAAPYPTQGQPPPAGGQQKPGGAYPGQQQYQAYPGAGQPPSSSPYPVSIISLSIFFKINLPFCFSAFSVFRTLFPAFSDPSAAPALLWRKA